MQELRANTAVDVLIGPFVDEDDGKTAEEGLTLAQADVKLSKLGQALAQKTDANAATHDSDGYYNCPLDTTDTASEGCLTLIVHESGALPVRHDYMVLSEAAWDSKYVAKDTGFMDVNIKAVSEDTAAADNLESACDNYSVTRGLTGTALPAAAADAAGGLPISDAGELDLDTQIGTDIDAILADTNELQTDDIPGTLATIDGIVDDILVDTGTTLQAELDGIQADTEDIQTQVGTAGAGLTDLGGMSTEMKAEVNAEVLDVENVDTVAEMAQGAPPATPTRTQMLNVLYRKFRNKTETTGSEDAVYNDAGDTKLYKAVLNDDDTTLTKAEYGTGA